MQINLIENFVHAKRFFSVKNTNNTQYLLEEVSKEVLEVLGQLKSFDIISERMSIFKDDRYELVLCNWASKSSRDWHYHSNTQCWFKCLLGTVIEHRTYQDTHLQMGDSGYIDDSQGPHQIENSSDKSAITLHIYKKTRN